MKKGFLMTFALLLVAVGAYFVSGTYARYTEKVTREGSATVAKWDFATDNADSTLTIKLDETYDASTLVSGKIAPGTSGSFDVVLVNPTTETAVDVNVKITKENVPQNLKFYSDSSYTTELTETELNATLKANDSTGLKKTIYWQWPYNTDANTTVDTQDTADGKAAKTMSISLDITGTQKVPGTTAVASQWN